MSTKTVEINIDQQNKTKTLSYNNGDLGPFYSNGDSSLKKRRTIIIEEAQGEDAPTRVQSKQASRKSSPLPKSRTSFSPSVSRKSLSPTKLTLSP